MRTQARPIVLVLAAVVLSGGCGGKASSERARVTDPATSGIVYAVNREGWNEIWVMDENGRNRRRLTDPRPAGVDAAGSMSPAWSPQGDRIAFVSSGDAVEEDQNSHELYVMDLDGGEARRLTTNQSSDADPTWSPDGKRIAFVRADYWGTEDVETSLRVIEADGSDEETLAQEDRLVFLGSPAWSPDGKRIAYSRASFPGKRLELTLHVMGSDGTNVMQVADQAAQPAWSPDGKQIAFVSIADRLGETCFHECDPSGEIYVANANGENARRLTKSKANDTSPAWSPDGKQIVFSSDRSNPQSHEVELYVVPASGGAPKRLTRNAVWDLDPDWHRALAATPTDKKGAAVRPEFDAWRGFRTRSSGIHCFMTGKQEWNGFVCFRASDGFYVRMVGRDLSTEDPVRVVTGTDSRLVGYENAEVEEIESGDHWASSDAHMLDCSVRRTAVLCRHTSDHGFFLDRGRHKTF